MKKFSIITNQELDFLKKRYFIKDLRVFSSKRETIPLKLNDLGEVFIFTSEFSRVKWKVSFLNYILNLKFIPEINIEDLELMYNKRPCDFLEFSKYHIELLSKKAKKKSIFMKKSKKESNKKNIKIPKEVSSVIY